MRLNKLLVVALAGMTMFSCSNNDEMDNGLSNGEEKTVVLKLNGIKSAKTRSMDTPTADDAVTMTVNKVAVIFYDATAGKVMFVDNVESDTQAWTDLKSDAGKKYSNINAGVDHVMVIGNASDKLEAEIHKGQEVAKIKKYTYSLAKENMPLTGGGAAATNDTKSNVTLYGDAGIEKKAGAGEDEYTASVKIAPLVSRFEVTQVGCKFGKSLKYKTLKLKGIGLVDYYPKAVVASQGNDGNITTTADVKMTQTDDTKGDVENAIYDPTSTVPSITAQNSYKFCSTDAAVIEKWGWSYDVLEAPAEMTANVSTDLTFQKDGDQTNYTFAYNFFPQDKDGELYRTPNICAWVEATLQNGQPDTDHTVVTSTMKSKATGEALRPVAGKIYKLEYMFTENDIDEWIPTITVDVMVEPIDWIIEEVVPEF